MKIIEDIEAVGKALWLKQQRVLIIADLHIGYEEALNEQGIFVPRSQFGETEKELKKLLKAVRPSLVVVDGDLKHEFGQISAQEWRESLATLDLLQKWCRKIVLIRGNHDTILGPIARKQGLRIVDYFCTEKICILHGDKVIKNKEIEKSKVLIIGHTHPAIGLREGSKYEVYKCFLLGSWEKQKLIVMPSFIPVVEGSDVKKEQLLSPYLHQRLDNFEVFIVGDKVYRFGKLKNIK